MNIFHCDYCDHLVFFENSQCRRCGRRLAYLPDVRQIGSLNPVDDGLWRSQGRGPGSVFTDNAPTTRNTWCVLQISEARHRGTEALGRRR